jgi:Baseplate J-like protein
MPDEQIIYLDPNDELTRVREKIEEVPTRRIIMVVPQQTQLRSNVGWRLLHARARELGKEVQVISPDRQVRAVAKAAGFRVSQPQEGSSPGRTRVAPPQNPRSVVERRGMQRQRQLFNRGSASSQGTRRREPAVPPPSPAPEDVPTETLPPRNTWSQQENPPAPPEEPGEPASRQGNEDVGTRFIASAHDAYPPVEIIEDDDFGRPFEFRIDQEQQPAARPLTAHPDEEEQQDPYIQDYDMARRIREAAQEGRASNPALDEQEPTSASPSSPPSRFSTPPEPSHPDPFEEHIEELSPSLIPEQRGATFSPDVYDMAPDVADLPTEEHRIEDVIEPVDSQDFPTREWENEYFNEPGERFPAPGDAGARSGRRSGKLPRSFDEDDEDYLPPADQPTAIRSNRPAPSGSLSARRSGSRGAQVPPQPTAAPPQSTAHQQPAARSVTTRPVSQSPRTQQPPAQSRPVIRSKIPGATAAPRRPRQPSRHRGRLITLVVVAVLVILLLGGVGFFYYGTTATATITVPSKTISLNSLKLVASTSTQSKFPNSVASQLLTDNASVSGTGTATGLTKQGNSAASGIVNFTNNGQQLVTVPSNTQLTTNAGAGSIPFITVATAVIPPASSGTAYVPIPVKAQNTGSSGNVAANTITVVPSTSITTIAQASSLSTSQINLTITNPAPLTGGGATQVPTVTQNDLQALKNSLHPQLQAQIKTWLQKQLHQGDISGTFFPDVVGSAHPLPQEQLTQAPPAGTALTGKTFNGTLSVTVNLLVVRYSTVLAAAQSQLNAAARASRPNPYALATPPHVQVNKLSGSSSKDGKTINITLSASALAVLQVDTQSLSMFLAGKTKDQATSVISDGEAGPRGVEKVDISISPAFLSIMPFRSDHIHIVVLPGTPLPKG